jgi:hypothetical protein
MLPLDEADRRREPRAAGGVSASVIMAGREPAEARLTHVSLYGCCVETSANWLRPGRFVAIALPSGSPLASIVRWTRGDLAGLELLRALPVERSDWLALID